MNANDVIESYVTDVAVLLPRRQRNDVAFELRALLDEELQAKAEAEGRAADATMAIDLVRAFGRPADVAARYRPTLTIIDPADGRAFVRASVIGLAFFWIVGLFAALQQSADAGFGVLSALGQWWGSAVLPSLWWPGMLVVGFGLAAWARRRWPQTATWQPGAGDRLSGGRAAMVMAVVGIVCGLAVLVDPRWLLDLVWGGRAAPAAYEAFTYAEAFRQHQGPVLFVLLALNVPLLVAVAVHGRWSTTLRRIETGLAFATCAVMGWVVLDGPVFIAAASDRIVRLVMVLSIVYTLIGLVIRLRRSVRPTPDGQVPARR